MSPQHIRGPPDLDNIHSCLSTAGAKAVVFTLLQDGVV